MFSFNENVMKTVYFHNKMLYFDRFLANFLGHFCKKPVRKRVMFGEPKIRGYFREGS